jgi:hypothetical protein
MRPRRSGDKCLAEGPGSERQAVAEPGAFARAGLSVEDDEPHRMAATAAYRVVILKAWDKDTLAQQIAETLEPYQPHEIVSVEARVDFQYFWPWRRDWAMLVLKTDET